MTEYGGLLCRLVRLFELTSIEPQQQKGTILMLNVNQHSSHFCQGFLHCTKTISKDSGHVCHQQEHEEIRPANSETTQIGKHVQCSNSNTTMEICWEWELCCRLPKQSTVKMQQKHSC